jgi:hypothetical protein
MDLFPRHVFFWTYLARLSLYLTNKYYGQYRETTNILTIQNLDEYTVFVSGLPGRWRERQPASADRRGGGGRRAPGCTTRPVPCSLKGQCHDMDK